MWNGFRVSIQDTPIFTRTAKRRVMAIPITRVGFKPGETWYPHGPPGPIKETRKDISISSVNCLFVHIFSSSSKYKIAAHALVTALAVTHPPCLFCVKTLYECLVIIHVLLPQIPHQRRLLWPSSLSLGLRWNSRHTDKWKPCTCKLTFFYPSWLLWLPYLFQLLYVTCYSFLKVLLAAADANYC